MSIIVDLVMIIGIVGLIGAGVIGALAILLYIYQAFKWTIVKPPEKAFSVTVTPDTVEAVGIEDLKEAAITQNDVEFHGRHHCSVGKGNE